MRTLSGAAVSLLSVSQTSRRGSNTWSWVLSSTAITLLLASVQATPGPFSVTGKKRPVRPDHAEKPVGVEIRAPHQTVGGSVTGVPAGAGTHRPVSAL